MSHPSDLSLEEHLLDRARHAEHLAGCPRCQERLEKMEAEGGHFRQFVYPATLAALERQPKRRWGWLLAPVGVVAAAAAVVVTRGPDRDYVGTKGQALKLTVYAEHLPRPLSNGDTVPAAAALRFRVQAAAPCTLSVVSVDDAGQVSRIFGPAASPSDETLPGGAVLDGRAGQERFFAVCSAGPLAGLEEEVKAAGVRAGATLSHLPEGSTQASLLLNKKP